MRYVLGVLLILHGFVHILYACQSRRIFELRPGMAWPDQSWLLGGAFPGGGGRSVAGLALAVVCALFVVAGAAVFFSQGWWRAFAVVAGAASSVVYLVFWDGRLKALPDQGAVGIGINAAIIILAAAARWPAF